MAIGFGRKLIWIFALLLILVMTIQVRAQPPPGFINIDCGLKNVSAYQDPTLKMRYSSDDEFVEGGEKHEVLPEFMASTADDNQNTLRSFPDGSRNCYTLPSTPGKKYLLRAIFTYGNYDRLNKTQDGSLFRFGLYVGVNLWDTVDLSNWRTDDAVIKEVLTVATGSSVSVCLVNLGSGIPFISSLELRPLLDTMYPFVNTSVSVSNFIRLRFGNITDYITRYPTDSYDRFWASYSVQKGDLYQYPYISVDTSDNLENLPGNEFKVPSAILQNAMSIDTNNSSITVILASLANKDAKTLKLLPIFHFTELNGSNPNRRFNIYSAGEGLFPGFSPSRLKVDSLYKSGLFKQKGDAYFILNKTADSSLPPLINALEVYALVVMENLTTDSDDVKYMKDVKEQYNLVRTSWNGDPCSPIEYSWKGLTCDYSKSNQIPRIITVNLSSSGLGGGLAISFMNMTSLENLDLSHNNLTGAIPEYQLKSLKVLNLSNNKLDGPIPDSILQRVQAGLLDLRLEGNPICSNKKDTYCLDKTKKRKATPILLIAVIVPVVLISLLVGMCILWKLLWKEKSTYNEDYAIYEEETPLYIDNRRFTYAELKLITNNFQTIVGKGGFGIVYHGILENGDEVAVKVLMETSIAESTDFLPEETYVV
uniref:Malectin-like domain-containing protein n=1 Tax=Aegilops tauschii subsp. strangulata TaxID=200361 RepID=A0A453JCL8_AEGTS